jgi:MFS family permease
MNPSHNKQSNTNRDISGNTSPPINTRSSWIIVLSGFVFIFVLYGSYYSFGVFLKPMCEELGWTRAVTTGAISLYMVIHGGFSIIMGSLSDKYGPRCVGLASIIAVALSYSLIYYITDPWHLYVCLGIMVGIGMGSAYVLPLSTVAKWFVKNRGLALGLVASGVGMGQMALPPLMRHLITAYGWRASFVIMGVVVLVIGVPASLLLKHPDQQARCGNSEPNDQNIISHKDNVRTVKNALKTSSFHLMLGIFMALVFGISIILSQLVAHAEDIGIDPINAAFILTLIGTGGIIASVAIAGLADRLGSKLMLYLCLFPQCFLFLTLIWANELWEFYLIAFFYGLTYGGTMPILLLMNSKFFGVASSGVIYGILIFGATSGGAFGAPLAGYIFDITGDYAMAFMAGGTVLLAGGVLSFIVKPPRQHT